MALRTCYVGSKNSDVSSTNHAVQEHIARGSVTYNAMNMSCNLAETKNEPEVPGK